MGNATAPPDQVAIGPVQARSEKGKHGIRKLAMPDILYSRSILWLVLSGAVLIVAIVIGTSLTIRDSRESVLVGHERELANTSLLLSTDINQKIDQIRHVSEGVASYIKSLGVVSQADLNQKLSDDVVQLQLEHRVSAFSYIDNFAIINSDGIIINASNAKSKGISVADREIFKALKSDSRLAFRISAPLKGRIGGAWKIIVAWKLTAPDGKFLGATAAAIKLSVLENYFRSVVLGEHGLITLQRADGTVLVRYPRIEGIIGKNFRTVINAIGPHEHGVVRIHGRMQDKRLLMAGRHLTQYPRVVVAGMDEAFALKGWRNQAIALTGMGVMASLLIAIVIFFIARQMIEGKKQFQEQIDVRGEQLNAACRHMSQGLTMFDAKARMVVCNDRYRQIYDFPEDLAKPGCQAVDLLKHRAAAGSFVGDPQEYVRETLALVARGETRRQDVETAGGRFITIVCQPMADGGWVATHEDITDMRHAELELDQTKKFLDSIIENIPLSVVVKDAKTRRIVLVNRAYETMLGRPRSELLGRTVFDIYTTEIAELIEKFDIETLESGAGTKSGEYSVDIPLRGSCVLSTSRLIIPGVDGNPAYLIVVIDDVTERKKTEQRISFMAHHDALTGLPNRLTVVQRIEDAATRQRLRGEPFSVFLLDLDRFKQINDTLGHPAGDALLRQAAARLKSALRDMDVLARLGGDEFAIVQTGEGDQREAAVALAGRIHDVISAPFSIEGHEINIATSIGIALAPEHSVDPDGLLKMADLALYQAKSRGRNSYCFFDPAMSEAASARHEVETELRRAIQQDELELHYQPIVDARTLKMCAAEALIRWRHPTKGVILPDQFIPLAEECGLITQIGDWVLKTACNDAARWPHDVKVAVNLSAVQFRKTNLPDVVMYALAQSGLPPERLELEITETALIESAAECLLALRQFKNLGIAVALDDFGTGYSSLSQLMMFPFDKIKIDKSFTRDMTKRVECAAIISAAQSLATNLNMAMTAEGVETIEQYRLLLMTTVTSLQGHFFKAPCPVSEIDFDRTYGDKIVEDAA